MARPKSNKGAAPAAEQPASTSAAVPAEAAGSDLSQHPLAQPAAPIEPDTAPGAVVSQDASASLGATPGAAEGASATAAPGPVVPEASDTQEAANDGPADADADLAATPAALPDQGAAAGATGADSPLDAQAVQALIDQGAADDILPDTADVETSGLAQDLGEIRLKVTAKATKTCARLLWLEGQQRTFVSSDLDPNQLEELSEDPDFELDFFHV